MRSSTFVLCFILTAFLASGQSTGSNLNTLSAAEKRDGWKLLFDGKTLDGWRSYATGQAVPSGGWTVAEGCLKNSKGTGRPGSGSGDILTAEKFTDFDLTFEWRIGAGGNSGVKYFIFDRKDSRGTKMYEGDDGRSAVGHEYQLLDDERHPDASVGAIRQTGSLYSLVAPNSSKKMKPVGEFNQSRILVQGKHVEHWLNGAKIVEYTLESPELAQAIAASKFKDVPHFGTKFATAILLQDHGEEVWFRNLKIRPLKAHETR